MISDQQVDVKKATPLTHLNYYASNLFKEQSVQNVGSTKYYDHDNISFLTLHPSVQLQHNFDYLQRPCQTIKRRRDLRDNYHFD